METKSTHLLFLVLHLLLAGVDDLVVVGGVLVTHLEGLGRAEISPLPFSTSLLKMASKFIEVYGTERDALGRVVELDGVEGDGDASVGLSTQKTCPALQAATALPKQPAQTKT